MTPSCREEETKAWLPRVASARVPSSLAFLFASVTLPALPVSILFGSGPAGEANGLHGRLHEKREA